MSFEEMWRDLEPIGRNSSSGGYFRQPFTGAERELRAWFRHEAGRRGFRVESELVGTVEPRIVDRAIARLAPVTMRAVDCGHPLFGSAARDMRSEALVLLSSEAPLPYGILLLGQKDAASLDNPHGTQLLGFLGASLGAMLRRWLQAG